jgi:aldehyde:ferredoxin oxidoreductase
MMLLLIQMSTKVKGYAGKMLRVDLSEGKTWDWVPKEETLRMYLGGTGMGAKILYDEVPPNADWSDPVNRMTIASGPLGGTSVGGTGTVSIVTKGALTGGATSVQANGLLGAYMKFSGYDGVILTGAADEWKYLVLRDGEAELRDASRFHGLDTYEVTDALRKEHGVAGRGASVLSIGPAGETLVRWAGVFVDHGHSASHNGPGAVLGSKKLKAIIAFRGDSRVDVHDPEALREVSQEMYEDVEYFRGTIGGVERMFKGGAGDLPIKNYSTYDWGIKPEELERFNAKNVRDNYQKDRMQCYGCRLLHSTMFEVKEGKYAGEVEEPEYEQMAAWGPVIGNTDVEAAFMLSGLTDRLGLDNNEAGWAVGWVMECMEKGILTGEQVGFRTGFGDADGAERLLRMVASREGFGDVLAEGVRRASAKIGGEAAESAIYTMKGNTPRGHDHRYRWAEMFDTCVSNTGTIESHTSVMSPGAQRPENPLEVSGEVARTKGLMQLEDSVGTCRFNTRMNVERITRAVSAATGWDMGVEEAWDVGRRAVNLMRAFNLQSGITAKQDRPSPRYGSVPVDGPIKGIGIMPHWDEMLRNYYTLMGWDPETGVPLRETLENLGLRQVAEDLTA